MDKKKGVTDRKVLRTIQAGDRGTLRELKRFGEALVCIRYRRSEIDNRYIKTVELIVDEKDITTDKVWHSTKDANLYVREGIKNEYNFKRILPYGTAGHQKPFFTVVDLNEYPVNYIHKVSGATKRLIKSKLQIGDSLDLAICILKKEEEL